MLSEDGHLKKSETNQLLYDLIGKVEALKIKTTNESDLV